MRFPAIPRTGLGLRDVFKESYFASPYQSIRDTEVTPLESLTRRSQGLDLARQYLPRALGGYGRERMQAFDERRAADPSIRERSLRVGDYPALDNGYLQRQGIAAEGARRLAQAAGATTADLTTQGALNIWWFINAAEAASMAAGQQGMYGALGRQRMLGQPAIPGAPTGAPFSMGATKVAAVFPLILGASAATGTLFRQPGYSAVLPSEEDRREPENALGERFMRAIGRTGRLLPYDEFVQERPDVSRGEYESYKAFLHGDKSLLKFNADGIHGAEVNFLSKSIPLLTGLAPLVGGVIGGRVGVRLAGRRLAGGQGQVNEFKDLATRRVEASRIGSLARESNPDTGKGAQLRQQQRNAEKAATDQLYRVEGGLLAGALAGTSAGLGVTAAGAQLLEQMRRAANLEENRRRQEALPASQGMQDIAP